MKESLTTQEKNYLKLINKSPFLFNEKSFLKMKEDLGSLGLDATQFVLEVVSFKL